MQRMTPESNFRIERSFSAFPSPLDRRMSIAEASRIFGKFQQTSRRAYHNGKLNVVQEGSINSSLQFVSQESELDCSSIALKSKMLFVLFFVLLWWSQKSDSLSAIVLSIFKQEKKGIIRHVSGWKRALVSRKIDHLDSAAYRAPFSQSV
jgi:hypothetical protein